MGRFTPGEAPVEPETAMSRIPYRDGEPDFTAVDAETGWEGLVEAMEGERNAREIAEQMAKDTAKDLEALENKRPKPVKPRLAGEEESYGDARGAEACGGGEPRGAGAV